METRGYRIEGRVQGVGFRWWTERRAAGMGLTGHVKNLRDGAVEVHVRGAAESVEAFGEALGTGPAGARVDRVSEMPFDESAPADRFTIAF